MRGRFGFRHAALLVVPALAVALVAAQGWKAREDPREVVAALRASAGPVLPPAALAGATSATEPARFDRETLYELVDGAADAYLSRGFERCVSSAYAFPGDRPFEVAAELHRFTAESGARAQLDTERPAAAVPVPSLPPALSDGNVLLAVRGRDLLKLTALTADPRGRDALLTLASAWMREQP